LGHSCSHFEVRGEEKYSVRNINPDIRPAVPSLINLVEKQKGEGKITKKEKKQQGKKFGLKQMYNNFTGFKAMQF
jgi:hypothetical protein